MNPRRNCAKWVYSIYALAILRIAARITLKLSPKENSLHAPMKPPFSYYGGKQRLISKLIPYIPKHTVYAEAFCGGATMLFKKPFPKTTNSYHYIEYINDTNENVINFFKVLRDEGERLAKYLEATPYSEQLYIESKYPENIKDNFERAAAFFININGSFLNKENGGWAYSIFGRNPRHEWIEKTKRIQNYFSRIRQVMLANQNALDFIKRFDAPQTFFYCDPPYPGTMQGHYKGYTLDDFKELVELADKSMGSFIISSYQQDDLFGKNWKKVHFESHCSAARSQNKDRSKKLDSSHIKTKRTEVIYVKQSKHPRVEIQRLYDSGKFDCYENRSLTL